MNYQGLTQHQHAGLTAAGNGPVVEHFNQDGAYIGMACGCYVMLEKNYLNFTVQRGNLGGTSALLDDHYCHGARIRNYNNDRNTLNESVAHEVANIMRDHAEA